MAARFRFADAPVCPGEPRAQVRVPHREELEFQHQHHPVRIPGALGVELAQSIQACWRVGHAFNDGAQFIQALVSFLLQQGKEQFFFILKVSVESAARVAGGSGNLFQPRGLETISGKNTAGRFEQRLACCIGSLLMLAGVRRVWEPG